jgi:hypothetical protein
MWMWAPSVALSPRNARALLSRVLLLPVYRYVLTSTPLACVPVPCAGSWTRSSSCRILSPRLTHRWILHQDVTISSLGVFLCPGRVRQWLEADRSGVFGLTLWVLKIQDMLRTLLPTHDDQKDSELKRQRAGIATVRAVILTACVGGVLWYLLWKLTEHLLRAR